MSIDRDLTDLVRSWLKTDEHESADRVLGAVFDRLDSTPQRRPLWRAWRKNLMSGTLKLVAAGTAIVLVVAIALGIYLSRPAVGPVGSSSPSVAPSSTVPPATPTASPTAEPTLAAGPDAPFVVFDVSDGVFSTPDDLWAMRADGTDAREIKHASEGASFFEWTNFAWSQDGKKLLLVVADGDGVSPVSIANVSADIGPFVDTGFGTGAEFACDEKSLEPHPCQDGSFTFAPDGQRVAFMQSCTWNPQPGCGFVTILDLRTGERTELSSTLQQGRHYGPMGYLAWSPDGTQLAYIKETRQGQDTIADSNLWIMDADGQNQHMVELSVPRVVAPQWSPDGQFIALMSDMYLDGPTPDSQILEQNVYVVRPDGTGQRQLTTDGHSNWPEWTRPGQIRFRIGTVSEPSSRYSLIDADGSNRTDLVDLAGLISAALPEGIGPRVPGDLGPTFLWQPAPGAAWYADR